MIRHASGLCVLTACVVATCCGCKNGTGGDGTVNNNNQSSQPDARPLPDVHNPLPEDCSDDDLVLQVECGLGRRCTVVSGGLYDGTGVIKCTGDGSRPAGQSCTKTLPDGPDDCQAGTICADPTAHNDPRCVHFCTEPMGFCPSGVCGRRIHLSGASLMLCVPSDDCDALQAATSCDATSLLHCYWSALTPDVTMCRNPGTTGLGQDCQLDSDCYPDTCDYNVCQSGLTCFGPLGSQKCRQVCVAGSGAAGCPAGYECLDVGHEDYGVCFDAPPPP